MSKDTIDGTACMVPHLASVCIDIMLSHEKVDSADPRISIATQILEDLSSPQSSSAAYPPLDFPQR